MSLSLPTVWNTVVSSDAAAYRVVPSTVKEGGNHIELEISYGDTSTYEIVDLQTNQVIGTATPAPSTDSLTIPLSSTMQLGNFYLARPQATPIAATHAIECRAIYGHPETTPLGFTIGRIYHLLRPTISGDAFREYVSIDVPETATADPEGLALVGGLFTFEFRPSSGIDPIIPWHSNNFALFPILTSQFRTGVVHRPGTAVLSSEDLGLGTSPASIGLVLLSQFIMVENDFYISDVEGFVIRPASHQ